MHTASVTLQNAKVTVTMCKCLVKMENVLQGWARGRVCVCVCRKIYTAFSIPGFQVCIADLGMHLHSPCGVKVLLAQCPFKQREREGLIVGRWPRKQRSGSCRFTLGPSLWLEALNILPTFSAPSKEREISIQMVSFSDANFPYKRLTFTLFSELLLSLQFLKITSSK